MLYAQPAEAQPYGSPPAGSVSNDGFATLIELALATDEKIAALAAMAQNNLNCFKFSSDDLY